MYTTFRPEKGFSILIIITPYGTLNAFLGCSFNCMVYLPCWILFLLDIHNCTKKCFIALTMVSFLFSNQYNTSPEEHSVRNVIYDSRGDSNMSMNMAYSPASVSSTAGERDGDDDSDSGQNTYEIIADPDERMEFGDNVAYGTIQTAPVAMTAVTQDDSGYSKLLESTSVRIEEEPGTPVDGDQEKRVKRPASPMSSQGYSQPHPSPARVVAEVVGGVEGEHQQEEGHYELPNYVVPDRYSHLEHK